MIGAITGGESKQVLGPKSDEEEECATDDDEARSDVEHWREVGIGPAGGRGTDAPRPFGGRRIEDWFERGK